MHTPELDRGGYPASCPFNTRRAGKVLRSLEKMGVLKASDEVVREPLPLTRTELEWFHEPAYLDLLASMEHVADLTPEALQRGLGSPDCPVFPGLYDFVRLAAGGTLTAARRLLDGSDRRVFNPSGGFHHAAADRAAGFCYVNDVVVALMELTRRGRRAVFLDVDVHHCDGVQAPFFDRDDVLVISLHESGNYLFPGTGFQNEIGIGRGKGYTVNVPLPVGTYDAIYEEALQEIVWPLLDAYAPDVIVLEMGMDALAGDPLAHLHLTNNVHADVVHQLVQRDIPLLMTGGGGYHVEQTVRGWALCWCVLGGEEEHIAAPAMGGVMLENTDWVGGLRDRVLISDAGRRDRVRRELHTVINALKRTVFPIHGIA